MHAAAFPGMAARDAVSLVRDVVILLPHTSEQEPFQYLTVWTEKVFNCFQHSKLNKSTVNPRAQQ